MLTIVWNSFKMALQELKNNKLRTFLSLFGITIGIFCIIGVLATVDSLEQKVQGDLKSFGTNTVYIDKWEYQEMSGGGDKPWWKFIKRPSPEFREASEIKRRAQLAEAVTYTIRGNATVEHENISLKGVGVYGVSEDFDNVLTIEILSGRYLSDAEFTRGSSFGVLGYTNAENLFGTPERAVGKQIKVKGRKVTIVGVIKKQGQAMGAWQFDECVIVPYLLMSGMFVPENSSPLIMVKGKEGVLSAALIDELRGVMRSLHRLSPTEEDDFSLNDVNIFAEQTKSVFGSINLGGWAIAGLSLIVGAFGVANIMFVTVRERTSQIGLKKAIGAKKSTILTEFLLESAFLCLVGGFIGLALVYVLTLALSAIMPFPIIISFNILSLAISICVIVGLAAGIIPAAIAAKMDPVVAIRTK
jgi:putative ABC transport system permease protein